MISNSFCFSWVFKDLFNKPDYNFDDVSKMATPGVLKTKVFLNKGYDVIICSCDQSLVTVAFLWEKLSEPQLYHDLTRKTAFFRGGLCSSSIIWDWD